MTLNDLHKRLAARSEGLTLFLAESLNVEVRVSYNSNYWLKWQRPLHHRSMLQQLRATWSTQQLFLRMLAKPLTRPRHQLQSRKISTALPHPHPSRRASARQTTTTAVSAKATLQTRACITEANAEDEEVAVTTISDIRKAIWEEESTCMLHPFLRTDTHELLLGVQDHQRPKY